MRNADVVMQILNILLFSANTFCRLDENAVFELKMGKKASTTQMYFRVKS